MSDFSPWDYGLPESWRKPRPLHGPRRRGRAERTPKQKQAHARLSASMMCREFTPEHRRRLSEAATRRERRKRGLTEPPVVFREWEGVPRE